MSLTRRRFLEVAAALAAVSALAPVVPAEAEPRLPPMPPMPVRSAGFDGQPEVLADVLARLSAEADDDEQVVTVHETWTADQVHLEVIDRSMRVLIDRVRERREYTDALAEHVLQFWAVAPKDVHFEAGPNGVLRSTKVVHTMPRVDYAAFEQRVFGLPSPNAINARTYGRMLPTQRNVVLGGMEAAGYDVRPSRPPTRRPTRLPFADWERRVLGR